jgi:hypothetical protein
MRHGLAILKYFLALLGGLLIAAWGMSWFWAFGFGLCWQAGMKHPYCVQASADRGNVVLLSSPRPKCAPYFFCDAQAAGSPRDFTGILCATNANGHSILVCPLSLVATTFLLLASGCVFRIPLWSYFAGTALVAAELTYYLR